MCLHYQRETLQALKQAINEIKSLNQHRGETPDEFIEYLEITAAMATGRNEEEARQFIKTNEGWEYLKS